MNPKEATANRYYNVNTLGTTIIPLPSNPRRNLVLVAIVVNTKGASSNLATIYDSNATIGARVENKIGVLDTVNTTGRIEYGLPIYNGIYIVLSAGTAADLTVIYANAS
jgi:hypothetical protein